MAYKNPLRPLVFNSIVHTTPAVFFFFQSPILYHQSIKMKFSAAIITSVLAATATAAFDKNQRKSQTSHQRTPRHATRY
jgi:hypothetical protein